MLSRVKIAREVIAGMGGWGSGATRVERLKKAGYNPDQVQGDVNTILCCRQNIITNMKAMANTIADNLNWWYVYWDGKYGHECAICHPHGGENHGWQCIGTVMAIWHHAGLPIPCNCGVIADDEWEKILKAKTDAEALKIAQKLLGIKEIKVIRNKNGIPKAQAKAGDMAAVFHGLEYYHTSFVMSSSKLCDATTETPKANNIRADRNFSGAYVDNLKVIIRYTGKGLCSPPKRTIDQLAHEVIANLWGSGDARVTALKQAGHDYDAVQKRVNEILNPPKPQTSRQDKMCAWAKKIADSGEYKYKKWKSGDVKTQQCPICKKLTGQYKGWNCIGFAWASWHHGGGLDSKCDCGVISNDTAEKMLAAKTDADALKIAQKYIGIKDIKVIRTKSGIAASSLKKGDVVLYFKGNSYFHTVLYVGNDKVAESNSGHTPNITYGKVSYHEEYGKVAIRYTGK